MRRYLTTIGILLGVVIYVASFRDPYAVTEPGGAERRPFNWSAEIHEEADKQVRSIVKPDSVADERDYQRLVQIGPDGFASLLMIVTDDKRDYRQRWMALMASAAVWATHKSDPEVAGYQKPYYTLLTQLLDDRFSMIRAAAAKAIGQVRDREFLEPLHRKMTDRALIVRYEVVGALAEIKDPSSVVFLQRELHAERNFIRSKGLFIRRRILRTLAIVGRERALPDVISVLREDDERLREEALMLLPKLEASKDFKTANEWLAWWEKK